MCCHPFTKDIQSKSTDDCIKALEKLFDNNHIEEVTTGRTTTPTTMDPMMDMEDIIRTLLCFNRSCIKRKINEINLMFSYLCHVRIIFLVYKA